MRTWLVLLWLCGAARADELPPPVAVKSVATTSNDAEAWKVVAATNGTWCQAAVSPSEALTVTFAAPTKIAAISIRSEASVTSAEAIADGASFKGSHADDKSLGQNTIAIKLGDAAITTLVVKLTGSGHACADRIDLGVRVVFGADASTLWSDVRAAKAALASCKAKQLAAAFVVPFTATSPTMTNDGMKWKTLKWTTAAKLATGCKNKMLDMWNDSIKLVDPTLESTSPTTLDIQEDATWHLEWVDGHWKVQSFSQG
jgi:hypothetical protein